MRLSAANILVGHGSRITGIFMGGSEIPEHAETLRGLSG